MILYGMSISPFVRKVMAYAAEKGIALEFSPVAPTSTDADFLAVSPLKKIPALKDGDFGISDSTAIIAYLEALHPEPALIPTEPRARARTVWYEEFADTILVGRARPSFSTASSRPASWAAPATWSWPTRPSGRTCRPCSTTWSGPSRSRASWSRIG